MAFSSSTVISGRVTKKTDYDRLMDNTVYNKANISTIQSSTSTFSGDKTFSGTISSPQVCKAWGNLDGTGTIAIIGSYNVASIDDLGTGRIRVNFTNAMPDALYSVVVSVSRLRASTSSGRAADWSTLATGSFEITTFDTSSNVPSDVEGITFHVFST